MNKFDHLKDVSHRPIQVRSSLEKEPEPPELNLDQELEKLAMFIAETWSDDHPNAHLNSGADFQKCVDYVTAEMVKAGAAVGGPAGLEILTGSGSKAARCVCRRVLKPLPTDSESFPER